MSEALRGKKPVYRPQPPGIVTVKIDPDTGERARFDDPDAIFEYFRSEFAPELTDAIDAPNYDALEETITEEIF